MRRAIHAFIRTALVIAPGFLSVAWAAPILEFSDCDECPAMVQLPTGLAFSKYPVTRKEFSAFAMETKHDGKGCYRWNDGEWSMAETADWSAPGIEQEDNHPVVCVSWLDATAYAEWLTDKTGRAYRLPTLEEFQEAARAGGETDYWWGADASALCKHANVGDASLETEYRKTKSNVGCDDGFVHTSPVNQFPPNPWGLHDMAGNVWQWTNSCLKGDCSNAHFRGGAWNDVWPHQFTITESFGDRVVVRSIGLGMRVIGEGQPGEAK